MLAIRRSDTLTTPAGEQRADALIAAMPARSWQRISVGTGAHGLREFRWARVPVRTTAWRPGRGHWLLARRPCTTPMRSPITPATAPAGPAPPIWPGPPGAAGTSRNASSRPRAKPGSITTRSGPGGPGTPTSPCPCSPWPGSRPAGPRRKKGDRHQRPGHDRLHVTGDPQAPDRPDPALFPRSRTRLVLVHMAPKTPAPSPPMPLPATRIPTQLSAVAVLSVRPGSPTAALTWWSYEAGSALVTRSRDEELHSIYEVMDKSLTGRHCGLP